MKKLIILLLLSLFCSCSNDREEINQLVDKFVEWSELLNQDEMIFRKDLPPQISEVNGNNCEVNVFMYNRITEQNFIMNMQLTRFSTEWKVTESKLLLGDKQVDIKLNYAVGIEELEIGINRVKEMGVENFKKSGENKSDKSMH